MGQPGLPAASSLDRMIIFKPDILLNLPTSCWPASTSAILNTHAHASLNQAVFHSIQVPNPLNLPLQRVLPVDSVSNQSLSSELDFESFCDIVTHLSHHSYVSSFEPVFIISRRCHVSPSYNIALLTQTVCSLGESPLIINRELVL